MTLPTTGTGVACPVQNLRSHNPERLQVQSRLRSARAREIAWRPARAFIDRSNRRRADHGRERGRQIFVESERAAQSGQAGVIEVVVAQDPPRFRVRWDDGRTSIFAPSAGVARIERRRRERVKAK